MTHIVRNPSHRMPRGSVQPWIAAGVLLLAVGSLFMVARHSNPAKPAAPPPPLAVVAPIRVVTFVDGSALAISAVGETSIETGTNYRGEMSGSRSMGCGSMNVETTSVGSRPVFQKFSGAPGNLLLACRLLDAGGAPLPLRCHHVDAWVLSEMFPPIKEKFTGWQSMLEPDGIAAKLPDVFVQVSDGAGGWIDGNGLIGDPDDREYRSVLAFPVWPRSAAELEFRAVRCGQPPVSWKMAPPPHAMTPAAWVPDVLPKSQTDPEFELEFVGATIPADRPGTVRPDYRFISKVAGDTERPPDAQSYQCKCAVLLGALGTHSQPLAVPSGTGRPPRAFLLPPDEGMLRFRFVVEPYCSFPYRRGEMLPLAKGRVSADGKSIVADLSMNPGNGLQSAKFENVNSNRNGVDFFILELQFASRGALEHDLAAAVRLTNPQAVCYVNSADISSGFADGSVCGLSNAKGLNQVSISVKWSGSAKPGDELTIGFAPRRPQREFIFTVLRPAMSGTK